MTESKNENLMRQAIAHHRSGRLGQAEDLYREVKAVDPNHPEALHLLGVIAHQVGKPDVAIAFIQKSLCCDPNNHVALANLSVAMKAAGRFADAADIAQRAIELNPNDPDAYGNLGNALSELNRLDEALLAYRRAVGFGPKQAKAWSNLGGCLVDLGRLDDAIVAHLKALELAPALPPAHWNLALAMLAKGDFDGWKEYEWRWKFDGFSSVRRHFPQPLWDGQPLSAGQRLLLNHEQGHGDTIQMIRYLPRLAGQIGDGTIILECQARLLPLLKQCPDINTFVAAGEALPPFDVHCPLMSLPLKLNDRLETIPNQIPYLRADKELVQRSGHLRRPNGAKLRVGLAWAGSSTNHRDHHRSMSLAQLASLASVEGVLFYSLQIDAQREVAAGYFSNLIDTTHRQTDFAQTAAFIDHLDLIISVDTSIAHLAGAMGKQTWILLPFSADWRWLRDREDSPWYPTARLFRQQVAGDWKQPIAKVREALRSMLARSGGVTERRELQGD